MNNGEAVVLALDASMIALLWEPAHTMEVSGIPLSVMPMALPPIESKSLCVTHRFLGLESKPLEDIIQLGLIVLVDDILQADLSIIEWFLQQGNETPLIPGSQE